MIYIHEVADHNPWMVPEGQIVVKPQNQNISINNKNMNKLRKMSNVLDKRKLTLIVGNHFLTIHTYGLLLYV